MFALPPAACRLPPERDGGEPLEGILDQLANDPDQVMADSVRTRLLDRATTRDDVSQLLDLPGFSTMAVLRKAEERIAVLDARQAQSREQLLAVVATGIYAWLRCRPWVPSRPRALRWRSRSLPEKSTLDVTFGPSFA